MTGINLTASLKIFSATELLKSTLNTANAAHIAYVHKAAMLVLLKI
jgi:hypothetical protein